MATIGIFDSGIGGLTVLRALHHALPHESFDYLGDTARLPYGSKSPETIRRYLAQNIQFLRKLQVKALIVACNSASTVIDSDHWHGLPLYGVIEPGARAALQVSKTRRIGVLGTRATVASRAYLNALHRLDPDVHVVQQACPLLVPLVEEGWEDDPVTEAILKRYLDDMHAHGLDTLILGCTHYPVLKPALRRLLGDEMHLVDSAQVMAQRLREDLANGRISPGQVDAPHHSVDNDRQPSRIWTTDDAATFREVGARILGPNTHIQWQHADLY